MIEMSRIAGDCMSVKGLGKRLLLGCKNLFSKAPILETKSENRTLVLTCEQLFIDNVQLQCTCMLD